MARKLHPCNEKTYHLFQGTGAVKFQGMYLTPQMTQILEDLTHKMEGQPPKKQVRWVLGMDIYIYIHMLMHLPYVGCIILYLDISILSYEEHIFLEHRHLGLVVWIPGAPRIPNHRAPNHQLTNLHPRSLTAKAPEKCWQRKTFASFAFPIGFW